MTRPHVPAEILDLAHRRRAAREARDWPQADALKEQIAAGGWTIIDRGTDFDLRPIRPPDVVVDGVTRYGSSASVPSRLEEAPTTAATVVMVASGRLEAAARVVAALRDVESDPPQVVIVFADVGPGAEADAAGLEAGGVEVVRVTEALGPAAAADAGIRRATGAVVILLDPSIEPSGEIVAPLLAPLRDPGVGIAGGWGMSLTDLRRRRPAGPGDVDAIDGRCLAFRRMDYIEVGPLDERLHLAESVALWWSLVTRDAGPERPPRRAVAVALPTAEPATPAETGSPSERDRLRKRDHYRLLERFGRRADLFGGDRA